MNYINEFVAKIICLKDNTTGSGFIYFQDSTPDLVYIFTAKHCIFGKTLDNGAKKTDIKIQFGSNGSDCYVIQETDNLLYDSLIYEKHKHIDIAVFIIPKSKIPIRIISYKSPLLIYPPKERTNCFIKGFPKAVSTEYIISLTQCFTTIDGRNENRFEINVDDSEVKKEDPTNLVEGYSGSGVFIEVHNTVFVCGIVVDSWLKETNRFACINFSIINQLLEKEGLSTIPILDLPNITTLKELNITQDRLQNLFNDQKERWLRTRYVPKLHGQGTIHENYQKLCFLPDFRKQLSLEINKTLADITTCISLIDKFIPTNTAKLYLNRRLLVIQRNLCVFKKEFKTIQDYLKKGNPNYEYRQIKEVLVWNTKYEGLEQMKPNHLQKVILPKLIKALERVHRIDLPQYLEHIALDFKQNVRLILGEAGTGKTHGLTNCVDLHLKQNAPALIIQAKECPCDTWTDVMQFAFNDAKKQFQADDYFTSLVLGATIQDAKNGVYQETTKVLICIDGLDEALGKIKKWYALLRGTEELTARYPQLRFIFSGRSYIYDNSECPENSLFDSIHLHQEGDVNIEAIFHKYLEEYDIKNYDYQTNIKGLNSLLALRLFCELYKGDDLLGKDTLKTTKDLLNAKIEHLDTYFKNTYNISEIYQPIATSLLVIAYHFYKNVKLEHNKLIKLLKPKLSSFLTSNNIENLIQHLVDNGIFIRSIHSKNSETVKIKQYFYNITYQSIIEHILTENIFNDIKNNKLNVIPSILLGAMVRPLSMAPQSLNFIVDSFGIISQPNEQIIQNLVDRLFFETGRLIGDDDFLVEGFNNRDIFRYKIKSLAKTPKNLAEKYKERIDILMYHSSTEMLNMLQHLILPASRKKDNYFGAEYLHNILWNMPSAFERDKFWSGLDNHEIYESLDEELRDWYEYSHNLTTILGNPYLNGYELHNETPLIYAWGLSTIYQELRHQLRVTLTSWAIKNPSEFLLLLDKIFTCNDPQIQEDLASITLGVASNLKDKVQIKALATWAITNVFSHLSKYRNVIIRQGFRAIVERAFQYQLITEEQVQQARPQPAKLPIEILPINLDIANREHDFREGIYPIVHDLKWYVIDKSYKGFLELPLGQIDNNCNKGKQLLTTYSERYSSHNFSTSVWTLWVAITYIEKELGLTRVEGNTYTEATHGSKSKIFTYEEKYTWLAVHYLQGYLADYVPFKGYNKDREFIRDYYLITDIPNPAEDIKDSNFAEAVEMSDGATWIIKEPLINDLEGTDVDDSIKNAVLQEPTINFKNWIEFDNNDFPTYSTKKWLALSHEIALLDTKNYVCTDLLVKACLVNKKDKVNLINHINSIDEYHFRDLDRFYTDTETALYVNPSDLFWMSWIEESNTEICCYDKQGNEIRVHYTLTGATKNGGDGESSYILPSKKLRELLHCVEFNNNQFIDNEGKIIGFNHNHVEGYERQKVLLVDVDSLRISLNNLDLEIIWFVELYKRTNVLNDSIKQYYYQKSKKYLVWLENDQLLSKKYWDEHFSNTRDKKL